MQEPAQAACPGKQPLAGTGLHGNRTFPWWATVTVILFLSERDTARVCFCPARRERGHDQLPQRPDQLALSDKDDRLTRTDLVDGPACYRPVRRRQAQGSPFDKVHAAVGVTLPSGIQHPPADASRSGHLGDHHPHPASMSPGTLLGLPRSSPKCLSRAGARFCSGYSVPMSCDLDVLSALPCKAWRATAGTLSFSSPLRNRIAGFFSYRFRNGITPSQLHVCLRLIRTFQARILMRSAKRRTKQCCPKRPSK